MKKRKKVLGIVSTNCDFIFFNITMGFYNKAMRKIMHYSMLMLCSHQKFVRQSTSSQREVIEQSLGSH